jgi:ribosomal protein S6--L-glutamate ligase
VRIVFINKAEKPSSSESIFKEVFALLEESGATVEDVVPEKHLFDLTNLDTSADLFVLRTRTTVGLNLAAALDVAGARLLIPFANERVLRNKFLLHQKLLDNGVPTPKSYLVPKVDHLGPLFDERGPLVVKPHEGHGGQGISVIRDRDAISALGDLRGPIFAQEYKIGTGFDVKMYGIGEHVAAIKRIFPARTPEEKRGTAFDPPAEMVEIARHCDSVLGLGLYGVDLIETDEGPFVIDINSLPGYKGIDGAARRVADFILERAAAPRASEGAR